ncbi:MAG: hypothetical protein ACXWLT_06050 [Rhizomicrobium sp.]
MQISAQTLLASQQTAQIQPRPAPAPGFVSALEKPEAFAPLPLKQAAPTPDSSPAAPPSPAGPARLGAMIDIRV